MLIYIASRYYGTDAYGGFAVVLLILGSIALIGILFIRREKISKLQNYYLQDSEHLTYFIGAIAAIVALLSLSWIILGLMFRYALSVTELYFYYLGAAIMEELFFRFFLCGALKSKIFGEMNKRLPENIENLIIAIISAIAFMLAHYEYYGESLMGMLSMFFGGIVFALFYLYTKDISITIIAHMIMNFIAVGALVAQYGGV